MPSPPDLDLTLLGPDPRLAALVAETLWRSASSDDPQPYFNAFLAAASPFGHADYAAVVTAEAGRWSALAADGAARALPEQLLTEAADRETPICQLPWAVAPIRPRRAAGEMLLFHLPDAASPLVDLDKLELLAMALAQGLDAIEHRLRQRQRIGRLETVLEIATQWNQTREVEPLLNRMAQAATRLLGADRASIFIWDRRAHTLIGRPALGVDDGQLRISDARGVVGRVIHSGRPIRVDELTEPEQIDRQVDARLGYRTRNVLCVPLAGRGGRLFGAFELLNKHTGTFTAEDEAALTELAQHAAVALENARDRQQLLATNRQIAEQAAGQVELVGQSPAIEALRSIVRRVADTDLAVLILGENGTGKEVVAQSIHYLSRRRDKPFIAVNCAAIPDTLAESELFGHEKGAFTDARETHPGKFELAAEGTLFLDEIGDLSLGAQAKLLRVLEEKLLVRLGGSTPIATDARVIAATNQSLARMVADKRFREDLYFRLNVVTLEIPPLRERAADIMLLADHFLGDFCRKARRKLPRFSSSARRRLQAHPWPGNVRELRNLMERLAYLSTSDQIEAGDLEFILSPRAESPLVADFDRPLAEATTEFQIRYIQHTVQRFDGNISRAAEQLGLHRSNLYRKMRQLGMAIPR